MRELKCEVRCWTVDRVRGLSDDDEASLSLNASTLIQNEPCQLDISNVTNPSPIQFNVPFTVEATITNEGTMTSVPTTVDLYRLLSAFNGPGALLPIQSGAAIPSLQPNESTIVQFQVIISGLSDSGQFSSLPSIGTYLLVIAEDATAGFSYVACNAPLTFEVDFLAEVNS